ncbi:hypothetical protein [Alloactinosynnema sp. L-07]|uniref:hypothetical protein n=1 Tax=Alloactinosynnema sp. L-07 TaxID=1653480 RepID=UPI00065EEF68|nr:hypothetical protein [Alloactinosynnema sp. L-07]CRK57068.1 hypothetical protein [Alloactinosynnema sp. L-07]
MSLVVAGQRDGSPQFQVVLGGIRIARPAGGRPRTRPSAHIPALSDIPAAEFWPLVFKHELPAVVDPAAALRSGLAAAIRSAHRW